MRKLYYSCPIKAAYMAKNFDVEFHFYQTLGEKQIGFSANRTTYWDVEPPHRIPLPIYVDTDSESIFDPKEGDLLKWEEVVGDVAKIDEKLWVFFGTHSRTVDGTDYEIIMRDNKHFFMPEIENKLL